LMENEKLEKKKVVVKKKKEEEVSFDFIENKELLEIDEKKIKLCCDIVCGNKVMSYKDNWMVEKTEEEVVYCVMNKIGNCEMLIERKNEVVKNSRWLKEYCRIGMVRGIFRVSDFNMRNVLIDANGELVSIDENDILGKRKDVFGMKNRAVLKELKKNENLLMELLQEIWEVDFDAVEEIVKKFGFDGEKIRENWMNLEEDVRKELNF